MSKIQLVDERRKAGSKSQCLLLSHPGIWGTGDSSYKLSASWFWELLRDLEELLFQDDPPTHTLMSQVGRALEHVLLEQKHVYPVVSLARVGGMGRQELAHKALYHIFQRPTWRLRRHCIANSGHLTANRKHLLQNFPTSYSNELKTEGLNSFSHGNSQSTLVLSTFVHFVLLATLSPYIYSPSGLWAFRPSGHWD